MTGRRSGSLFENENRPRTIDSPGDGQLSSCRFTVHPQSREPVFVPDSQPAQVEGQHFDAFFQAQ